MAEDDLQVSVQEEKPSVRQVRGDRPVQGFGPAKLLLGVDPLADVPGRALDLEELPVGTEGIWNSPAASVRVISRRSLVEAPADPDVAGKTRVTRAFGTLAPLAS